MSFLDTNWTGLCQVAGGYEEKPGYEVADLGDPCWEPEGTAPRNVLLYDCNTEPSSFALQAKRVARDSFVPSAQDSSYPCLLSDAGHTKVDTASPIKNSEALVDHLEGVPQDSVQAHQTSYVKYAFLEKGHVSSEWSLDDSLQCARCAMPHMAPSVSRPMPLTCSLRIIQAPAAFGAPIMKGKPFKPPFKVRLDMKYRQDIRMDVSVSAITMCETPPHDIQTFIAGRIREVEGLDAKNAELAGSTVKKTIDTASARAVPQVEMIMDSDSLVEERTISEEFMFNDLKFLQSSRVNKRWIVFYCKIDDDIIYCHYHPATIVLSRADQFPKAMARLDVADRPARRMRTECEDSSRTPTPSRALSQQLETASAQYSPHCMATKPLCPMEAVRYVIDLYNSRLIGVNRKLSVKDQLWLVKKLGLNPDNEETQLVPLSRWNQFEKWYSDCLETLKTVIDVWDQTNPAIICGLYIDRTAAEHLLRSERAGTFLVRMCSEPGCFAISTRVNGSKTCDHLLLDRVDLNRRGLTKWIQAHDAAKCLLDVNAMQRVPKDSVISRGELKSQQKSKRFPKPAPTIDVSLADSLEMQFPLFEKSPRIDDNLSPLAFINSGMPHGRPMIQGYREDSVKDVMAKFCSMDFPKPPFHDPKGEATGSLDTDIFQIRDTCESPNFWKGFTAPQWTKQ
uniref:SH2 domain-containing protein n=2 Tax=Tetraselmis sp. GSL018 TaxID=582737 RepID=A0A061S568_9CHLO